MHIFKIYDARHRGGQTNFAVSKDSFIYPEGFVCHFEPMFALTITLNFNESSLIPRALYFIYYEP